MRLIDADAFKKYIRGALEDVRHLYKDNGAWAQEITESFCKDIDEQPTIEAEPHWIPCSKRLPAVPVCRCLITRDYGRGGVTVEEALSSFGRWYDNKCLEDGRNRKFDISASVIALAPFPAPYLGGDSE